MAETTTTKMLLTQKNQHSKRQAQPLFSKCHNYLQHNNHNHYSNHYYNQKNNHHNYLQQHNHHNDTHHHHHHHHRYQHEYSRRHTNNPNRNQRRFYHHNHYHHHRHHHKTILIFGILVILIQNLNFVITQNLTEQQSSSEILPPILQINNKNNNNNNSNKSNEINNNENESHLLRATPLNINNDDDDDDGGHNNKTNQINNNLDLNKNSLITTPTTIPVKFTPTTTAKFTTTNTASPIKPTTITTNTTTIQIKDNFNITANKNHDNLNPGNYIGAAVADDDEDSSLSNKNADVVPSIQDLINISAIHQNTERHPPSVSHLERCPRRQLLGKEFQPVDHIHGEIRKCCPENKNYQRYHNITMDTCSPENVKFNVTVVNALFYEGCIEDVDEHPIYLPIKTGNPCDSIDETSFIYSEDQGDTLYVLQNGSLLRVSNTLDEYDVFDVYCLDMDRDSHKIKAIVCDQTNGHMVHVSKAQSYLYAICMLVSVPCLLVTSFLYLRIPKLRNLHGKSLACHSICLALGFLLLSIAQIRGYLTQWFGYVILYLILACFFWLAVMCVDICTHVWWFIPRHIQQTQKSILYRFIFYAFISFGIPVILVLLSVSKELPGIPSYYLKGSTETTRLSQQYFIPPISSMLFICFILLVTSYFGFRRLNPQVMKTYLLMKNIQKHNINVNLELIDIRHYTEVKQTARSTAYLYIIMTINWIFEIISFYINDASDSLVLFDILNALQGIVIFIIFVSLPQPIRTIRAWWNDRGSLDLKSTEMQALNTVVTTTTPKTITTENQTLPTKQRCRNDGNYSDDEDGGVKKFNDENDEKLEAV